MYFIQKLTVERNSNSLNFSPATTPSLLSSPHFKQAIKNKLKYFYSADKIFSFSSINCAFRITLVIDKYRNQRIEFIFIQFFKTLTLKIQNLFQVDWFDLTLNWGKIQLKHTNYLLPLNLDCLWINKWCCLFSFLCINKNTLTISYFSITAKKGNWKKCINGALHLHYHYEEKINSSIVSVVF